MQLDCSTYRCEANKRAASKLRQEEDEPLSKEERHKSGALAGDGEKVTVAGHAVAIITYHVYIVILIHSCHICMHTLSFHSSTGKEK